MSIALHVIASCYKLTFFSEENVLPLCKQTLHPDWRLIKGRKKTTESKVKVVNNVCKFVFKLVVTQILSWLELLCNVVSYLIQITLAIFVISNQKKWTAPQKVRFPQMFFFLFKHLINANEMHVAYSAFTLQIKLPLQKQ